MNVTPNVFFRIIGGILFLKSAGIDIEEWLLTVLSILERGANLMDIFEVKPDSGKFIVLQEKRVIAIERTEIEAYKRIHELAEQYIEDLNNNFQEFLTQNE